MPEAVDRLELVAHEEELAVRAREQVDELALQPVRVLELVDHDRPEAPALALADLLVLLEQLARQHLEVLEVERRLPVLGGAVGAVVGEQELFELGAVARGERFERGGLDRLPRFLELGLAGEVREVEQRFGTGRSGEELGELALARPRAAELGDALVQLRMRPLGRSESASPDERSVSWTPVSIRRRRVPP